MVVGGGAEFLHNNRKHQIYQFPKQKGLYTLTSWNQERGGNLFIKGRNELGSRVDKS